MPKFLNTFDRRIEDMSGALGLADVIDQTSTEQCGGRRGRYQLVEVGLDERLAA